jgi:NAD-dependent deacetylase
MRSDPKPNFKFFQTFRKPPVCECGGLLKPATISFGQSLNDPDIARARDFETKADLVIALGSMLSVQPAANIPLLAVRAGAQYVIINQGSTDPDNYPSVTLRIKEEVGVFFVPAVRATLAS